MALTNGTVHSVHTLKSDAVTELQVAEILFTMSGTYATAEGSTLLALATLIQNSRRNGKTVTVRSVTLSTPGSKASDNSLLTLKTVALAAGAATFKLAGADYTTEIADAAIPAQNRPFALLATFTEA